MRLYSMSSKGISNPAVIILLLLLLNTESVTGNQSTGSEVFTVTGSEFLSEMKKKGYDLNLLVTDDDNFTKKLRPGNNAAACRLARNAELTLTPSKLESGNHICRLTGFKSSDRLAPGWKIEKIQWRGDHQNVIYRKDPESTHEPQFSLDLVPSHNAVSSTAARTATTRIRLVIVRLTGPVGASWKDAFP
jgi:uncharacterized protein (DUF2237 family)